MKYIAVSALRQNSYVAKWIPESLKEDEEIKELMNQSINYKDFFGIYGRFKTYRSEEQISSLFPRELLDDKEFIIEAIKHDLWIIEFASPRLRDDEEVILTAVSKYGHYFRFASDRLRNDISFVSSLLDKGVADAYGYATDEIKENRDLALKVVNISGGFLDYVPYPLNADREIVLAAVENTGSALQYASDSLRHDKEIILKAIKQDSYEYNHVPDSLKNDFDIVV